MHGPNSSGQRQLTQTLHLLQRLDGQLPAGGQNAQRDGQIKTPAVLGQVGGRQIEGDTARRKLQAGIDNRAADPVFAFFNRAL